MQKQINSSDILANIIDNTLNTICNIQNTSENIKNRMSKQHNKNANLRAVLCKNQTKWEMKNFEPPSQIYMEVGPHEGCSKMSIIEVITQLLSW